MMRSGTSGGRTARLRTAAAVAGLALAACLATAGTSQAQIPWTDDLAQAKAVAARTDAVLLLHFYTDNCVPCRMLESRAFRDPQLVEAMKRSVVPCRVDADKHRDVAAEYGVTRWPTDVYLAADGSELGRSVSPQQVPDYLKLLDRIAGLHHSHRQLRSSTQQVAAATTAANSPYSNDSTANRLPTTETRQTQLKTIQNLYAQRGEGQTPVVTHAEPTAAPQAGFRPATAAAPVSFRNDQQPSHPEATSAQAATPRTQPVSPAPTPQTPPAALAAGTANPASDAAAMSGYCPVTLAERWDWVGGQPQYAVRHRGRVYHMVDADAVQKFMQYPDRYAPMFSGYDLVHFLKTGRLIDGSREFGCQYQGRIYLFASQEHRAYFDENVVALAQPAKEFESLSEGTFVKASPEQTSPADAAPRPQQATVAPGWVSPQVSRDRVATVPTEPPNASIAR